LCSSISPNFFAKPPLCSTNFAMATIGDNEEFDVEVATQKLRDAMEGLGTDEDSVSSVLGTHSNSQLLEIKKHYTAMFGRDLIDDLQGETKGHFEELCVALVRERMEFVAHTVHDALSGAGTSEQIIADIFGTIHPGEVEYLAEVYKTEFEKEMQDDITSDVSGYFERFLIAIMSGGRSQDEVDWDLAAEDADKLYNAGEGTYGTDECAFMSVFMTRSWEQLAATIQAYEELRGDEEEKTLLSVVKSEFTGSEEKLLTTIVRFTENKYGYFADVLRECMKGVGTSETRLNYTVVRRSEIDLALIRDEYNAKYEEDVVERIKSEVGSDLGTLLSLLVSGNTGY